MVVGIADEDKPRLLLVQYPAHQEEYHYVVVVVVAAAAAAEPVCNMVALVVVVVHSKDLEDHMVAAPDVVAAFHGYLAMHPVEVLHIAIVSILAEDREVVAFEQYFHLQTAICLLVRYLF